MTSFESDGSNAFETNGISIEISNPHQLLFPSRVYSIPQNQLGVNAPIKLSVRIVNNTSNLFHLNPLQTFIPELLTSDGQIKQGHLVTDELVTNPHSNKPLERSQRREFEWWKIRPKLPTSFFLTARLFWQNNSLKLKIPSIPDHVLGSVNPNYFWCFDSLRAENYQFRLILNTDRGTTSVLKADITPERNAQETSSEMLATSWVNFRLVQPLSTDNSTIEVDGVLFKIEMPETILTVPSKLFRAKTDVKLGVHVTNNTSTALRFYQSGSVDTNLTGDDGKAINWLSDPMKLAWGSKEPKYYLVQPGKSAVFDLDGKLFWYSCQLQLAVPNKTRSLNGDGGFYYFPDLKPGASYYLQVIYHVSELRVRRLEEQVSEKIWAGWIAMPSVKLLLVKT